MKVISNNRISNKEANLIKGAIRRVFSRSELRREVVTRCIDKDHVDSSRPRVKTWCKCDSCGTHIAKSDVEVDHIIPVIPLDKSLLEITWDELVNRIWCDSSNLQGICENCHKCKTKEESLLRRNFKRAKINI